MSSNAYYQQSGAGYTTQQLAHIKAHHQQQEQACHFQTQQPQRYQSSAACYPSPVSSNSPDASSPIYQVSPTLYKSQPNGNQSQPIPYRNQPQGQSSRRTSSTSAHPQKDRSDNWYCMYPDSAHQSQSFSRKADLKRHYDHVHNAEVSRTLDCPEPGCHRKGSGPLGGFGRKDKLVEHLREVHGKDIPKRYHSKESGR